MVNNCKCCQKFCNSQSGGAVISCPCCDRKIADATGMVSDIVVAETTLKYIPASVAFGCGFLPLHVQDNSLQVAVDVTEPDVDEWLNKLQFVVEKQIIAFHADRRTIDDSLERHFPTDPNYDPIE